MTLVVRTVFPLPRLPQARPGFGWPVIRLAQARRMSGLPPARLLQVLLFAAVLQGMTPASQAATPHPAPGSAASAKIEVSTAFSACKGAKTGDACSYSNVGGAVDGHCALETGKPLACAPEHVKPLAVSASKAKTKP